MRIQCEAIEHWVSKRFNCPTEQIISKANIPKQEIAEIEPGASGGLTTSNIFDPEGVYFFHNCNCTRKVFKITDSHSLKYHIRNHKRSLTDDQLMFLRDKNIVVLDPVLNNKYAPTKLRLVTDLGNSPLADSRYKPVLTNEEITQQDHNPECLARIIHQKDFSCATISDADVSFLLAEHEIQEKQAEHEAQDKRPKQQMLADKANAGIQALKDGISDDNAEFKDKLTEEVRQHTQKLREQFDEAEKYEAKLESGETGEKLQEKLVCLRQGLTEFSEAFEPMVAQVAESKGKIRLYEALKTSLPEEAKQLIYNENLKINNVKKMLMSFLAEDGKKFFYDLKEGKLGSIYLDDQNKGLLTTDFTEKIRNLRKAAIDFTSMVHKHYDLRADTGIVTELSQRISADLDINDTEGAVGGATGGF